MNWSYDENSAEDAPPAPERDPWEVPEGEFVHLPDPVAAPISYDVVPAAGYTWTFPAEGVQ